MKNVLPVFLLLLAAGPSFAQRTTSHDINGIRQVVSLGPVGQNSAFNFLQSPTSPASLTATVQATVTLTPCPLGIDTSNTGTRPYYVYVSATGTPERVLVTGGTCTPALASGTIIFTPDNGHTAGYQVGSASSGIGEALNDAQASVNNATYRGSFRLIVGPTNPANTSYLPIYAPITINQGVADIDFSGAGIDCEALDKCFYFGTGATEIVFHGARVSTHLASSTTGAITNTACSANVSTITTSTTPAVPTISKPVWIDIQNTDQRHYWGFHQVLAVTPGVSFTLTDNNCTFAQNPGGGTIASAATPGGWAYERAFAEDNGTSITFRDIYIDLTAWRVGLLNNGIVVDNDQAVTFENFNDASVYCDANYCGFGINNPGPFSGFVQNPAVGRVKASNISPQCGGNGINWLGGNTLKISDTVIQGFAEIGVQTGIAKGGFGPTIFDNVYMEIGSCLNPLYSAIGALVAQGASAQASQSGVLALGGIVEVNAAIGSSGSVTGQEANFAGGTGSAGTCLTAAPCEYWVVIHDGAGAANTSMPLRFGEALTSNGSSFTIAWPRYASQTGGTVTYDILKTTGAGFALTAPVPDGVNHSIAVATAVAQCSGVICTATDTQGALSAYSTIKTPILQPYLNNWPGSVILDV